MRIYILTREINDSITNVLGAYKNKEQAEQEVMLNKKKDDINFRSSKVVYEIQSFEVLQVIIMEIIQLIILYITFLISFIIIAFMLLLFGNGWMFNDKSRDSIEELEVIIKRTFKELMEKIINFIDELITKIRRIK